MIIGIDGRVLQEGEGGIFVYVKNLLERLPAAAPSHQIKIFVNQWRKIKKERRDFLRQLERRGNVKIYKYKFPSKIFNFSLRFFNYPFLDDLIGGCDVFF